MFHSAVEPQRASRAARRVTWMDLLRGSAVLLVMANHAIGMAHIDGWEMPQWLMDATRSVEPFRLPLLLLVSGLFLPRALTKPLRTYVSGKLRHLAWPLLLWAPLTVWLHVPECASDPSAYLGASHLWYLLTLLFCYAVGLVTYLMGVGTTRWLPAWTVPVAFLAILFNWMPDKGNYFWFGAFFFVGAWLVPHVRRLQSAHWSVFLGFTAVAVIGSHLHVHGVTSGQNLLVFGIALAGCGAALWAAPRIPRNRVVRWLEGIGRRSIVYYVVHLPVIAAFYNLIEDRGIPTLPAVAAAFALAFAVPSALVRAPWHGMLFSFPAPSPAGRLGPAHPSAGRVGPATKSPARVETPTARTP